MLRIDAMDELRAASNEVELERVQRNLARLQRLGDKHGVLAPWKLRVVPELGGFTRFPK